METKKQIVNWMILLIITLLSPFRVWAQTKNTDKMENINSTRRFRCIADDQPKYTAKLAKEVFALCPPILPGRFDRRMWRLWGLRVSDYPQDSLVIIDGDEFTGVLVLSPKYRMIRMKTFQNDPLGREVPDTFPAEKYALFYRYMMMDDGESLNTYYGKYRKTFRGDFNYITDFMLSAYAGAVFDGRKELMEYIDKKTSAKLLLGPLGFYNTYVKSNIRMDATALYVQRELGKGRQLYFSQYEEKYPDDNPDTYGTYIVPDYDDYTKPPTLPPRIINFIRPSRNNPYPISEGHRLGAGWLSTLLKYGRDDINKSIVGELYKQYDSDWRTRMDNFKVALEKNDYYGYTLLREFLTNPMRETPTLEKIGNHFRAVSRQPEIFLYIEPFGDSYAIDTIRTGEIIQVYETGHDSYYFTEIKRPVESPVADYDGYAKISDRKETVYGYVKKSEIKRHTDANLLAEFQTADTAKSKLGKINDPDGYVNIRREMNAQSEILGKIQTKDVFSYWEVSGSNWCVVKTQDGIFGFVYKDRIKEKLNTGDWVILDDD
jgi:hypothetical protein